MTWDSRELAVNCFEIQVMWLSTESSHIWLEIDLRFRWKMDVNWFKILMLWLLIDVWFKGSLLSRIQWLLLSRLTWFGCQLIWDSFDLVVNWWELEMTGRWKKSGDVKPLLVKWFELVVPTATRNHENEAFLRDFIQKSSFEAQKRRF